MSTGGRISSFFSTVAGPFHPFGGAVDIIIVQQQDGSFKSTPWYVRFGKFQGVLKRSENIVTVSVNGVDADFHLYLDNTGEAYLLKEAECCEEEGAASPRSSRSSDEQMLICNGSFKSVMSHPDMDDDCDVEADSEQVNSLMKDSSNACKRNGNIVITISEHGSVTAEKQEVNDLPSRGSEDAIGESSGPKQTLKMVSDTAKESNVNNHVPLVTGSVGASSLDTANEIKKADVEINNGWDSNEKTSVFVMEESLDTYTISRKCSENHSIFLSGYNSYEYEDMEFQQINLPDLKKSENENTEMVLMSVDGHMMRAPITSFKIVDSDALKEEFIEDHNICQGAAENSVDDKDIALSERHKEIDSRTGYAMESVVMDSKKEYVEHENEQGVNLDATAYNRNLQCLPTSNTSEEDNLGISDYSVDPSVSHLSTSESNENKNFENVDRKNLGSTTDYEHHGRINGCELTKNESELTLNDDDDLYKSCANFSELCSPMEEQEEEDDEADVRLSPHAEEDEVDDNVAGSIHTIRECDNVSCFQMDRTSPIDVPGSHSRNKDIVEAPGSLPNMISNISAPEMSDSERICSRSLDSSYSSSHRSKIMEVNRTVKSPLESFTSSCYKTVPEDETPQKLDSSYVVQESSEASNERLQLRKAIEISLCRDLLYKGMGAEAAASAFESKRVSKEYFKNSASDILKNEKLVVKIQGRYFPWPAASSIVLGMVVFDLEAPIDNESEILVDHTDSIIDKNKTSDRSSSSPGMWRLWPLPFTFRRPKTPETNSGINARSKSISKAEEDVTSTSLKDEHKKSQHHKVRTKTPSSDQLASLNLKEGQNMITFTYETSVLGKHQVDARIYLWKWNTRIVISDVDGTITKSDVLGQVMPWVGKDWTQTGVARLFSAIKDNGYQLLFLSARAIAQAYLTRQFLLNLKQDGKTLPDGPVVISPDGLFPSLYREVIRRAPHEFKISCLEDIRALFPPDCNPFYAGFGNRDTDEISYLKVGIPKGKIFIINPKGQVVVNHCVDVKSYTSLHKLADDMFPAVFSSEQEDFNSWNFWKVPLPEIED